MFQRMVFEVKCTDCGKSTNVPFEPTKGKPVHCKTYFSKHRIKERGRPSLNRRFDMKNAWAIREGQWQERKEEHHSIFQKP